MKISKVLFIILLLLSGMLFLAGCSGYHGTSMSTSMRYGVYDGYRYPYNRYGYNNDVHVHVDNDNVERRQQRRQDNKPARQQKVQSARAQGASMGRPARGGRGGRR